MTPTSPTARANAAVRYAAIVVSAVSDLLMKSDIAAAEASETGNICKAADAAAQHTVLIKRMQRVAKAAADAAIAANKTQTLGDNDAGQAMADEAEKACYRAVSSALDAGVPDLATTPGQADMAGLLWGWEPRITFDDVADLF